MTRQRQIILEELRRVTSHPTADQIYDMVRRRLPRISLGTVYRNLEMMSEEGLIQKLELGCAQKRFDGNPRRHYHVRCTGCGRVGDVDTPLIDDLDRHLDPSGEFEILGHRIEFIGLCRRCRAENDHREGNDNGS